MNLPIRILICCVLSCTAPALPAGETAPLKRVLLVHSFGRDFAPFADVARAFREHLSRNNPEPVEFFETSLEMARFEGSEREAPLVAYLESVCAGRKPDLVVPVGAPALEFCHRNRARLFGNAPVLAAGADKRRIAAIADDPRTTSVHFELDLGGLARGMKQLLPEMKHVYVIFGSAPLERYWEGQLKKEWPGVLPDVEIHWLGDLSLREIQATLAELPEHSAVFHGILARDADGAPHEQEEALTSVRLASRAPVFGYAEEQLGAGIVGGELISMGNCGRVAAGVAVRLLAGDNPDSIQTPPLKPGTPVYDWRELKHWNIPHHLLPETRQIRYQPPGLWETHRNAVLVAGSALTLQSVGIVLLLAARRRARESEASLRLTAEAAKIGLWDHPSDRDDLIEASPEWRDLFDLPRDGPLKTADVLKRIHPDDLEPITQSIENARRHGIGYELEHRVIRADGSTRWISSRGRAEPDSTGRHSRTRGISMDITRRKHAEAELVKQRENLAHLSRVTSLGELSGALAHELNQPLGSILSNAQAALKLLSLEEPRLPDVREILSDIVSEDQRAANVIKRLRALLERGETQPEVFNPHEAFEEVLALTGADLAARGITINRDFGNDIPLITADRVQLQQVFINLISNACEAMAMIPAENKTLNLRTSTHGTDIIIEVRDSGCGFREPAENLFQPFHTTKSKGLGMGLAICQSILTAHHGSIRAESPPEGGAVFLLTLPARHPNP